MDVQHEPLEGRMPGHPRLLQLYFGESQTSLLLSLSSLLYDIELAHDLSVLLTYPEYRERPISARFFFYRDGRRLSRAHRVRLSRISQQSPLFLELVVGGAAALWALLQIVDKVSNWKLNRQKLHLEIDNLNLEKAIRQRQLREEYEEKLEQRHARGIEQRLVERLNSSEFRLVDIAVQDVDRTDESDPSH